MIDQAARGVLLFLLLWVAGFAPVVYRRAWRPSRRSSVLVMMPTLAVWILFEVWVLMRWDIEVARWLSRLGVVAIVGTFLYQLWSIDYAERIEQAMEEHQ